MLYRPKIFELCAMPSVTPQRDFGSQVLQVAQGRGDEASKYCEKIVRARGKKSKIQPVGRVVRSSGNRELIW